MDSGEGCLVRQRPLLFGWRRFEFERLIGQG